MNLLSSKHIAVIGLGSGGSALTDMLARSGVGKLTLVDHDNLTEENLKRHVLGIRDVGSNKAEAMQAHVLMSSDCEVIAYSKKYEGDNGFDPHQFDVIACCADSDLCCQLVNDYSLRENIPAVYGAVWGAAETAEIITVFPKITPCYACYEREGPEPEPSQEKYTNPDYDSTKMPHQEGLWCDVVMAAAIQFRAILTVLNVQERIARRNKEFREKGISYGCFGELWSDMHPLLLASLRPPYGSETIRQKRGCAVCSNDFSRLAV